MDLATIEITPEEAERRLEQIHDIVDYERTVEDHALAAAYRAAKRGYAVISLKRAFELAGEFDNGLPRLAIVRATVERCRVDVRRAYHRPGYLVPARPTQYSFSDADFRNENRGALVGDFHVNVEVPYIAPTDKERTSGSTIVPLIPPEHRPRPSRLRRCHIIWEVERWDPTPPKDPALVKHIRGDLWAVLATWDLSELERLVLSQRARP